MSAAKIAIVGASGQLGSALRDAFAGREVVAPAHAALAFEDRAAVEALLDGECPDVLVNCSAFHHVDTCEREPARAFAANALAVDAAAGACASRGVVFVTVSTDYVFDGTLGRAYREDDAPNPLTVYGASKLAGELLTRRHGPRHIIMRTSGVFAAGRPSNKGYTLVEKVLQQAERGAATRMVGDMVFSPSYTPDVARAMRDLIDLEAFGTHHVTNAGVCSWYDFVARAFAKAGLAGAGLERIGYAELGNPTRRPMCSPLENTTFAAAGIAPLRSWEAALDAFLQVRAEQRPVASAVRAR